MPGRGNVSTGSYGVEDTFPLSVLLVLLVLVLLPCPAQSNTPVPGAGRSAARPAAHAYWDVRVQLSLTAVQPGTHISMLLPLSDGRQSIVSRRTYTPGVRYWEETDAVNLWGHWRVTDTPPAPRRIRYAYTVQIAEVRTVLPQHPFPFQTVAAEALPYLAASEMIQSDMPQVQQRAWQVVQHAQRLDQALEALYGYIAGFAAARPGDTASDASAVLSAERGGRAGKARALVAVLRAVGIPARMVGGIRLGDERGNVSSKPHEPVDTFPVLRRARTTMYWAEAFVGRRWVALDPAGGYLGWLPNTYLALYRNDLPLLGHTRQVSVDYSFVIRRLSQSAALDADAAPRPDSVGSHEHFWTASAGVDRPRASAVLIHDGQLSDEQLRPLLDRARTARINAAVFSIQDGSRAFRQAGLEAVFEAKRALLADADLVLLSTRDAAGLYALLSQAGWQDEDTFPLLHGPRLVLASGVARPVSHVFAALIERALGPASVVLLPHQPDPGPAWATSLAGLTRPQRGDVSSKPMNRLTRSLFHAPHDNELGWWRARVVGVWHDAIGAGVSLPALNAILVLPVIAFFLVIGRNLIGLETFGFFAPMLLALAFLSTGLGWGLLIFGAIIGIGGGLRVALQGLRLHLVARVAILIAVVALSMAGLSLVGARLGIGALLQVGIFPTVILANMIENFSNTQLERGTREALRLSANTLLVALVSYGCIENTDLRPLLLAFPELLVGIIGLELVIGCWRGMRLIEYVRFARVLRQAAAADRR